MDRVELLVVGARSAEDLFRREFTPLVQALTVADGAAAAADAVQVAFMAADRRWRRVVRSDDPAAWVRRVALARLAQGRQDPSRAVDFLAPVRPRPDDELDPSDLASAAAVRALSREARLVLCLHQLGGFGLDEIALDLGITEALARWHLEEAGGELRLERLVPVVDEPRADAVFEQLRGGWFRRHVVRPILAA